MENVMLVADTINGVYETQPMDFPEVEFLSSSDFIDSLGDLSDGERVFTSIMPAGTDGVYEQIDTEYGISK